MALESVSAEPRHYMDHLNEAEEAVDAVRNVSIVLGCALTSSEGAPNSTIVQDTVYHLQQLAERASQELSAYHEGILAELRQLTAERDERDERERIAREGGTVGNAVYLTRPQRKEGC